jgi:hypothetical protein
MSKDPVPNVRINVAKALKIVIPRIKDKSGEVRINYDTVCLKHYDRSVKRLSFN